MKSPSKPRSPQRRRFMIRAGQLAAVCAWTPVLGLVPGCKDGPPAPAEPLRVPLALLKLNERTRVMHGDRAVELVRTSDGVRARSLLCTHQGCNVRWVEEQQVYFCPCHDGKFDADGTPIYGPPRESLRDMEVTVTDTEVIIGG